MAWTRWFWVRVFQSVGLGFCHMKACLGLEDLLPGQLIHIAVGRSLSSSTHGPLHNGPLHRDAEASSQCVSCPLPERVVQTEREQGRTHDDFCDLASKVTLHHVCNILLVKHKSSM